MQKENLLGQKFGRLIVIDVADSINKRVAWKCQCDCGKIKTIKAGHLKDGTTKSCGCLNDEKRKARAYNLYALNTKYHPSETTARCIWRKRYNDGISFEDFYKLSQMNCFYCDAAPNNMQNAALEDKKSSQYAKDNGDFIYNGLDRIDNSLKHVTSNVVPCCKYCNFAKRERTVKEFEEWAVQLYNTIQKRKNNII